MPHTLIRRTAWIALILPLLAHGPTMAAAPSTHNRLAALEREVGGRLGVTALGTGPGFPILHRADEHYPFCSTFKLMVAAAILKRSVTEPGLLAQQVTYSRKDLITHSPITEKHVDTGMTVSELCAATLQYSDNAAANLLMKRLNGPAGVTTFARSIGDTQFRLDRWEPALNEAKPGDPRDTTTPAAMARSLQRLALGDALTSAGQRQLTDWLRGNTTGATRIRAGLPTNWQVGDKTGTGQYGVTNDVAVVWPPKKPPFVLSIYYSQKDRDARSRSDVVARAARIVADTLKAQ